MRIRIAHATTYAYEPPAKGAIQVLRMTPRNHDGQYVSSWRIEVDRDCRLKATEDSLGNITHSFTVDGPLDMLVVLVIGEVETEDTSGLVRGAVERFPPALFLRDTALTRADVAIRSFAREAQREDRLGSLHALMTGIHARMRFDVGATDSATSAAAAFALGHGVCQDHAHVFVAAARSLGYPARYVSGYLLRSDGANLQEAGHAWAEAHLPGLGWTGFDPANGVCPAEAHVRVAIGLDYLAAAPVRGARYGGGTESLDVQVRVDEARRQMQS